MLGRIGNNAYPGKLLPGTHPIRPWCPLSPTLNTLPVVLNTLSPTVQALPVCLGTASSTLHALPVFCYCVGYDTKCPTRSGTEGNKTGAGKGIPGYPTACTAVDALMAFFGLEVEGCGVPIRRAEGFHVLKRRNTAARSAGGSARQRMPRRSTFRCKKGSRRDFQPFNHLRNIGTCTKYKILFGSR